MSITADAAVVGAGIIGSSVALQLANLGLHVVVVDKTGGPGLGSTSASSAIVRFNYSTWEGVAAWESKHCWQRWHEHLGWFDDAGMAQFRRTGMVMLDVPIAPRDRTVALFDRAGVPYEEWDARTLAERIPGLDVGRYWPPKALDDDRFFVEATGEVGGLFMPDAGYIDDPLLAAHNLAGAAQARGATFLFHRTVSAVEAGAGAVRGLRLSDGTGIAAPIVVNAAGPWSSQLNEMAGVGSDFTISVRPMRQEVHQVPAPDPGSAEQLPAIADLDLGVYTRPAAGGHLLIGGTEPACDPVEWLDDPDAANPRVTPERFAAQVTRAARRLQGLTVPNKPVGIAGVYDVADDWTPIYDRTDVAGFYVAIGTSGNQFKNAPLAGRFIAAIVDAVENGHDHDTQPVRYYCEHTNLDIDLSAFSRKRPVNEASSGTVMG
jgi:sarcosine oxidase, subunit beta